MKQDIAFCITLRGTKAINLTGVSGSYVVDEKITQATTGAVGKVLEWDSSNNVLYYIQTRHTNDGIDSNGNLTAFSEQNVVTGVLVARHQQHQRVQLTMCHSQVVILNISEMTGDSGDILYIENRAHVTRARHFTEQRILNWL